MIVNARHIKYVPGHKTGKKDSAWICKLLKAGLLKGSFVPGQAQRDLRDLTRYRRKLVQSESAEHNRLIRVLEDANLKLSSFFSNVTGKTCTMIIDEILNGKTDAAYLTGLCTNVHLKHSQQEILEAVEGRFTEHHKFMLKQIRKSISNLQDEIKNLDAEIDRRVQPFADRVAQIAEIPGMGETSAKELLAEIGVDMSYFPTDAHLASWAGLCPGNNESAGKKSSHTNHGNKATKEIITECAWSASRTKGTFFSARYSKLAGRRGKKRALVALGNEILKVVYHMLKDGTAYKELGSGFIDDRRKNAVIHYHKEPLKQLGVELPEKVTV